MMTHGLLSIETIPRPFLKNQTSLDQYPKVLHRLFLNVDQIEGYLNIMKLRFHLRISFCSQDYLNFCPDFLVM